jgi:hypothetical protein
MGLVLGEPFCYQGAFTIHVAGLSIARIFEFSERSVLFFLGKRDRDEDYNRSIEDNVRSLFQ